MSRKRCKRKVIVPVLPKGLRPRLTNDQVLDLGLVHAVNLDTIAKGEGDEGMLWDWIGGVLTWSKAAELMQLGVEEMNEQLGLAKRLVERYGRTGRVAFSGPDYQLAKIGLDVMDQLAERVDRHTAGVAADWSEAKVNQMAAACTKGRVAEIWAERMVA